MALTFTEVKERLKRLDTIDIVELLQIQAEDLVDRFEELLEERLDEVELELNNWFAEDKLEEDEEDDQE